VRHTVLGLSVVGFVPALENSKTDLRGVFRGTYYAAYKRERPHQFTREILDTSFLNQNLAMTDAADHGRIDAPS